MTRHCNLPVVNGRISVRPTLYKNCTRVFSRFTVLLYSRLMKTIVCTKPQMVQNTVCKTITPGYYFTESCPFKKNLIKDF